jgi:hypothetical protein
VGHVARMGEYRILVGKSERKRSLEYSDVENEFYGTTV